MRTRRHRRGLPLSYYVETYLSEMARDTDCRKMFDPKMDSEIRQVKLNPAMIVRSDKLNIRGKVDPKDVESLAWSIYMNEYLKDKPLWVGLIDGKYYIVSGHYRHAALDFLRKDKDAFPDWQNPKIPCLVKSMTWDDLDRLSSLIALDSTEGKTLTRSQRHNACTNLLTYPHYWILTDIELAKKWGVNHATINRSRKKARERLHDDDGQISVDRKAIMNNWISRRERLLQERYKKNGEWNIRPLGGQEPKLTKIKKWENEEVFTKWLKDNINELNDVIDLSLSNVRREQAAGDFSVDLVAEDESGNLVVIENQLEQGDHKHLGQVITYLTARDAKAAIWIVKEARPEHINAISWLNESSSASFYLIKIGDSEPLLTIIVDPSMDRRKVAQKKDCSRLSLLL